LSNEIFSLVYLEKIIKYLEKIIKYLEKIIKYLVYIKWQLVDIENVHTRCAQEIKKRVNIANIVDI
jgi:hypothetical protein